jgi:hypothetical protein
LFSSIHQHDAEGLPPHRCFLPFTNTTPRGCPLTVVFCC